MTKEEIKSTLDELWAEYTRTEEELMAISAEIAEAEHLLLEMDADENGTNSDW